MMYKSCSRCGKLHPYNQRCNVGRYQGGNERGQRSTRRWTDKSLEIREKAMYLCEVCRDKGVYTYKNLEVHHIDKVKDEPTKLLDDFNLVCLCTACHKLAERGEFKKEYLKAIAEKRETQH